MPDGYAARRALMPSAIHRVLYRTNALLGCKCKMLIKVRCGQQQQQQTSQLTTMSYCRLAAVIVFSLTVIPSSDGVVTRAVNTEEGRG